MIKRDIAKQILKYAKQYPVITITGPRQSGKTTLCKYLFPDKPYISLENIENRSLSKEDPKAFLKRFPDGAIFDEIQQAPELSSWIQEIVDERDETGLFILTGSQQFEIMNTVSQSLAGRTAIVKLLPFSRTEISKITKGWSKEKLMLTGFYPRIYDKKLNPSEAMLFYVQTYLERDIRQLINIKDLSTFERFLKLIAGRTSQLVNLSAIGDDCGVSYHTVKNWLSILEASYVIKLVQPYYKNLNKRLVKSPEIIFYDTGLLCFLLGIKNEETLSSHPLIGSIFENYVVAEIVKQKWNRGETDDLYFFRDDKGHEIDIMLDKGIKLDAIEVKYGQTFKKDFLKNINWLESNIDLIDTKYLIYGGDDNFEFQNVQIVSWANLEKIIVEK